MSLLGELEKDYQEFLKFFFHKHPKHRYRLKLTTLFNHFQIEVMSVSLAANQEVAGVLSLVDQVTGLPVTATFTNVTATSDTVAAATASVDASNNIDVIGVAAGTGNVTVSALTAYTDSTGTAQSQTLTLVIPFTITAVTTADAVLLAVTFGAPTAQ